jgi:DNA invertase Pin-like site-specific DNA recombinase
MNRPLRALIYARYSSDVQSANSTEDQIRVCRRLCEAEGWTVVQTIEEAAISGASHLRPSFHRLHVAARDGVCDVIVAEALDRLSRDQEHMAGLYKRLAYHGVKIVTRSEGEIDEMRVGFGGLMSSQFLKQLAEKTRRGLEGRVMAGKSGGGNCYGYRVRRGFDAGGAVITGERDIDDAEAAVVRRIFADYDAGLSERSIAAALNAEGVAPPPQRRQGFGQLVVLDDPGQLAARDGDPEQRALRRGEGLAAAELREGPGHRQAPGAAEPAGDVGDDRGAGAADHRCGALGPGEGPAGRHPRGDEPGRGQ